MTAWLSRNALLAALVGLGLAYRLVYVFDSVGRLDGDNAVVALMARHALEGKLYVFFWGQEYMGTIEPITIAALAAVAGLSDIVLRLGPLVWGLVWMASFYPLARDLFGTAAGRAALGLAALGPPLLVVWSSSPRGGYATMLALGNLILWLTVKLGREDDPATRTRLALALGVVAGLAWWTHLLALSYLAAAALMLVLRDRRLLTERAFVVGLAGFFVASLPFWLRNLETGGASFAIGGGMGSLRVAVPALFLDHGPDLLGVRDLVGGKAILAGPLGWLAGAILALAIARGTLIALRRVLRRPTIGPEILVVFAVIHLALYLPNGFATLHTDRYLLPLYAALIPLAAVAWVEAGRRFGHWRFTAASIVALPVGLGALSLHQALVLPGRSIHLPEVIAFLESRGLRGGYADHVEALVNTYRSEERIVLRDWRMERYPMDEVPHWRPEAMVVRGDGARARQSLEQIGVPVSVERFATHAVLHGFVPPPAGPPLETTGWRATASLSAAEAVLAFDGDLTTRWATHAPQSPGASFELDLGSPRRIAGLRLRPGAFRNDWPRGLAVLARQAGVWVPVARIDAPWPGLTVEGDTIELRHDATMDIRFPALEADAVRLELAGSDPRFDWSIAELEVLPASP